MKLGLVAAALAGTCNEKAARKTDRATAAACSALGSRLVCFAGFTAPSYGAYSVQIKLRLAVNGTSIRWPRPTKHIRGRIALGFAAGGAVTTANNVICMGTDCNNVNHSCFIGNIRSVTTSRFDAIPVLIDSLGQLGTISSSRRYKKEIKPMDQTSEAILGLKPVTFHYKSDSIGTPQFGLIAEDVVKVNPDLVIHDADGKPYTVRYDAVNAMLLNEFLKEHRRVDELKSAMAQQRKDFETALLRQRKANEALIARLNEQEAWIQKVSAQVEANGPGSQMLVENQ
jgi:hypothetical protein